MIEIDTSDRSEQRKFGVVMAVAILVLGLIRWGIGYLLHPETVGGYPWLFAAFAAPFLVLAIVWPRALKPIFDRWLWFALVLNWIMTHTMLTIAWFLLFVPMRGILRVAGKKMLKKDWEPAASTYWEEPEAQPDDIEKYRHQF